MLFIAFNSLNFIIFLHKNNLENILQANPVFVWSYIEILPLGYKQGRKRGGAGTHGRGSFNINPTFSFLHATSSVLSIQCVTQVLWILFSFF